MGRTITGDIEKLQAELAEEHAKMEDVYDRLIDIEDTIKRNLGSGNMYGMCETSKECDAIEERMRVLRREIDILRAKLPPPPADDRDWTVVKRRSRRVV